MQPVSAAASKYLAKYKKIAEDEEKKLPDAELLQELEEEKGSHPVADDDDDDDEVPYLATLSAVDFVSFAAT